MDKKVRLTEIDLLRFMAAFSVMVYHYTMKFPDLVPFTKYGRLGVNIFFLISGFVIMMTAWGRSSKDFIVSRMVRLYPAFWACCTITFLVALFIGIGNAKISISRYLLNMTMMHGFFNIGHVDGVYWTLFVEMKFYLLILILIYTKQLKNISYYLGVWLIISILSIKYFGTILDVFFITSFSAYFISGAIFYLIYKEGVNLYKIFLLSGSFLLAISEPMLSLNVKIPRQDQLLSLPIFIFILGVFYFIFFMLSTQKTKHLRSDYYIFLGALTYPLYLLHSHIWYVVTRLGSQVNPYVFMLIMMAIMLILAFLVHKLIEEKLSPVFKKFLDKKIPNIL